MAGTRAPSHVRPACTGGPAPPHYVGRERLPSEQRSSARRPKAKIREKLTNGNWR